MTVFHPSMLHIVMFLVVLAVIAAVIGGVVWLIVYLVRKPQQQFKPPRGGWDQSSR